MRKLKSLNEFMNESISLNSKQLSTVTGGLYDVGAQSMQTQYGEATCVNNRDDRNMRKRYDNTSTGFEWGSWSVWYVG